MTDADSDRSESAYSQLRRPTSGNSCFRISNQASVDQGVHILAQRENGSTGRPDAHIDERVASDTKGAFKRDGLRFFFPK